MVALKMLIKDIASKLEHEHWQIVTAESCTGGMIASALTEIPGSSNWFERGFVTYSNLSKQELLDVPEDVLIEFGAVSEQVAVAMAIGALQNSAGHIAVSVTGIAGPDGGSPEKPVGLVCFGWAAKDKQPFSAKEHFKGSRQDIRIASVEYALQGVYSILSGR